MRGWQTFRYPPHTVPTGDQPRAIGELTESVNRGDRFQTLLGATGTGKTHTVARLHRPRCRSRRS